jgi:tetratricopeptide (TPR) repeat protein
VAAQVPDGARNGGQDAGDAASAPVRVFLSYAHESESHIEAVRDLWLFLRRNGIDARLDTPEADRRQDWPLWMGRQVRKAEHVLIIASQSYRRRSEGDAPAGEGRGVQWEARLIRDAFYAAPHDLDRWVPVILPGQSREGLPDWISPNAATVYPVTAFTLDGAESLLRLLLRQPAETTAGLGRTPSLPTRDHTLSGETRPNTEALVAAAVPTMRHEIALHLSSVDDGRIHARTELAGTVLGEQRSTLPVGLQHCWDALHGGDGAQRLHVHGQSLWHTLFDTPTGTRLVELITTRTAGAVIELSAHLPEELSWLPIELLRTPDGALLASERGVSIVRHLTDITPRPATPPSAGPLKILAAVAAPDETRTQNTPLDVEAEMQAILDAVTPLDTPAAGQLDLTALGITTPTPTPHVAPAIGAQVRILEVAALAEIRDALAAEQFHVLHLSAHGSPTQIELEDEDGNPDPVSLDQLVSALRAGKHPMPLLVLSSCSGAAAAPEGLAGGVIRSGGDRVIAMQAPVTDRYATLLSHALYRELARNPASTVAAALTVARSVAAEQILNATRRGNQPAPPPEWAVPTLLAAGTDTALRDPTLPAEPLARPAAPPAPDRGVRELPLGELIGRRPLLREAWSVIRRNPRDRDTVGEWAGVALIGVGGIGKTALAGRLVARARGNGWAVAEHVGSWNPDALFGSIANAIATTQPPAAAALRSPDTDQSAKLQLVLAVLQQLPVVVLFDDFEQNLTPDTRTFTDPGFAEIFTALTTASRAGRMLVTCRYPVPGTGPGPGSKLHTIPVGPLSPAEQRRLFLRLPALRDLSPDDRVLVTRTIGGHPRLIEFLDVLLREGTGARFLTVTEKLRGLADDEGIDLRDARPVPNAIKDAVRLGTRDILLDALIDTLTPEQLELLLQASLFRASADLTDIDHTRHGPDPSPEQVQTTRRDTERLTDLTLLTHAGEEYTMHSWIASALNPRHSPDQVIERHHRGADMRLHRINTRGWRFDDLVDLVRHFAQAGRFDEAIDYALSACDIVGGQLDVAALLAETVPLIPVDHPMFFDIADRECSALMAIGLASATANRYESMLAAVMSAAAKNPGPDAEYLIAITRERLGNLSISLGDTRAAAANFTESVAVLGRLAELQPSNMTYQRAPTYSHGMLGDLAIARGDSSTAEQHYRAALTIAERLAAADPGNAEHQRDFSISHEKLGDLAVARGDTTTAERHYRTALTIAERLAAADPGNAGYQRDLSISQEKLGNLAIALGDTTTAEQHYRTALTIAERLATADPGNAEYQRDLSVSHDKLGNLALALGDTTTAEQHYRAALTIAERLATADPGNADYQRDLSVSHDKLGDLAAARGDTTTADHHYRTALTIAERLATADPGNASYRRDLSYIREHLAELDEATSDPDPGEQGRNDQ